MIPPSGENLSLWLATAQWRDVPPLRENLQTDVCVIGGGIAGLTAGYFLALNGRSVVLIDDGPVGNGETHHTTAHLSNALDDRYTELERVHGARGARLAAHSHMAAIDTIEEIVGREQIDCDFERLEGYLFTPRGESDDVLTQELEAARRAGVDAALVDRVPIGDYDFGPALRFTRQGQFHPMRYMNGLAQAFRRVGGRLFSGAHANRVEDGSPCVVHTATGYAIEAGAVVVATNTPINDRFTMHTKQAPYRTYVIAASLPAGTFPSVLLWDTLDPYHYVRVQRGGNGAAEDFLIVGGEDHKTGQAEDYEERFDRLEAWARERFTQLGRVTHRWSGQVMEPYDYMAYIGLNPGDRHVFIATGDSGHGMTHGTIAGLLLNDLILGRENEWATLYDPSRKSLRPALEYARENLNVALQYTDHLLPGDVASVDELIPGQGAIVRRGLRQIAAFRDETGKLHQHSAVCPHLGCIVAWNVTEQSWDCPCHGSRYDRLDGHVLTGPAVSGLTPIDD